MAAVLDECAMKLQSCRWNGVEFQWEGDELERALSYNSKVNIFSEGAIRNDYRSAREMLILMILADGGTIADAGRRLGISYSSVVRIWECFRRRVRARDSLKFFS